MSSFQKKIYKSVREQLQYLPSADEGIRGDLIAFCETLEKHNPDWIGEWYQEGDSCREWEAKRMAHREWCREHNSRLAAL